jgi:hypothetical protein
MSMQLCVTVGSDGWRPRKDVWPCAARSRRPSVEVIEREVVMTENEHESPLHEQAFKRLKKRRDFYGHLLIYALVNAFFVVIWAVTTPGGFFWPVFPIVGWGIGVAMNAWDVYFAREIDEEAITEEMRHIQQRR